MQSSKDDRGESAELYKPIDEVSGASVPVEGIPSGVSVAHSPRVSDFGRSRIQEMKSSGLSDAVFVHDAVDMGSGAELKVVSANGATDAQTMLGRVQEAVRGDHGEYGQGSRGGLTRMPTDNRRDLNSMCHTSLRGLLERRDASSVGEDKGRHGSGSCPECGAAIHGSRSCYCRISWIAA